MSAESLIETVPEQLELIGSEDIPDGYLADLEAGAVTGARAEVYAELDRGASFCGKTRNVID